MRRLVTPILIVGCLAALVVACYGSVLFQGRQFGYRDAAHYYYPLYWRVQQEWQAGRVPLWEPEENAGMPLLGNPTAAVLYPGKVIYALLPYPWAARMYVIAHTALAFAAMLALMRSFGASGTASALSALAYAFGAPILFQYCNIIFLVGAAWTPLGFRAADRWLRRGRRWGLIELAVVLAMLVLGGDPESAYVLGICAGGYAIALAWSRGRVGEPRRWGWRGWLVVATSVIGLVVAWVAVTLELAHRLPVFRTPRPGDLPPLALPWMRWVPMVVAAAWGIAGLGVLARGRRRKPERALGAMLLGLAGSAVLAAALSGAQLLPVLEFTGQTGRAAGGGPHDIYPFSLEPIRAVELAWPNIFGTSYHGNRAWLDTLPPERGHAKVWVPSLYLGGLSLVLAVGAMGFRGGAPGRGWLSVVVVVSLVASLGEYTGPLWWARWVPSVSARIGPHDPQETNTIRLDGQLRDGDGSVYWLLATALPGFRQFRFPSKLLSFSTLALAGLAGLGWDRLMSGPGRRREAALAATLLAISVLGLAGVLLQHHRIVAAFAEAPSAKVNSAFGPLDAEGAFGMLRQALAHGAIVLAIALVLALRGSRRPALAGAIALVVMTADLAVANAHYVLTIPQALLDAKPKVVTIIEAAEREAARRRGRPEPGPFRVHRMPIWSPIFWKVEEGDDRIRDFVVWERDTIQPKYGLMHGIQYTMTLGVAEIYDFEWFFGGFYRTLKDVELARRLNIELGRKMVVFPRRPLDMWNSRYFVLPMYPNGWSDENRGYASLLADSELIYPPPDMFQGPGGSDRQKQWADREDFQVFRNRTVYPRAWVVHAARFLKPIVGLERTDRDDPMNEIVYSAEPLWHEPGRVLFDPRHLAWMDVDRHSELSGYLPGNDPLLSESPEITSYGPRKVELDVNLERPGLVILAEIFYPGWRLTIDGADAPIYRANRMMRGAAVKAGKHHLVYTYEPRSFRIGLVLSAAGIAALAALGLAFTIRPE